MDSVLNGRRYVCKLRGKSVEVEITGQAANGGGWAARNLETGRAVTIRIPNRAMWRDLSDFGPEQNSVEEK